MKIICKNKNTGKVINDFQPFAKADGKTLIFNAVNNGYGIASDFIEFEVSDEEFARLEAEINAPIRAANEIAANNKKVKRQSALNKLKNLGLTDDELSSIL